IAPTPSRPPATSSTPYSHKPLPAPTATGAAPQSQTKSRNQTTAKSTLRPAFPTGEKTNPPPTPRLPVGRPPRERQRVSLPAAPLPTALAKVVSQSCQFQNPDSVAPHKSPATPTLRVRLSSSVDPVMHNQPGIGRRQRTEQPGQQRMPNHELPALRPI